jgi:hypothetical protein
MRSLVFCTSRYVLRFYVAFSFLIDTFCLSHNQESKEWLSKQDSQYLCVRKSFFPIQ